MLTSPDNPKIKYFSLLKTKKKRTSSGKFLIEGIHLVSEALRVGQLENVIYCSHLTEKFDGKALLGKVISSNVPHEEVNIKIMKQLSQVESPQGIIAIAKPRRTDLGSLFEIENPSIVIACGIQDPGNLGTIIRTADAAGCSGLVISSGTADPYNEKAIRASSGSIFHLNIVKVDDIIDLITSLKRRGIKVISAVVGADKKYYEIDYKRPFALVIGNEGQGLPEAVEKLSDFSVSIPIMGGAESLNAAVSSAVILYEALKQRQEYAG